MIMMKCGGLLILLGLSFLNDNILALHDDIEESYCSGDAGIMLQKLVNDCFGDSFDGRPPPINFCNENGGLNCPAIKNVLSISPSCHYCDNIADNRLQCYVHQKRNANCAINNFLGRLDCVKEKGQCRKKLLTTNGIQEVTTLEQSSDNTRDFSSSTPSTEFAKYGYDRDHGKHNRKEECKPCECHQTGETTGISIGLAVGLLIAGLVIGAVVTGVICVCVPSMNRSEKRRISLDNSTSPDDRFQGQGLAPSVADSTLPVESSISYPVVPSAPPQSQGSIQTGYHTLGGMTNNRDSHTYSGLQPDSPEYFEPMAGGGSYQSPQNKPMKNPKTVGSPVYQEFSDNVIPSSVNNNSKQNANGNIYNSLTQNQPIKGSDTNTDATNQNYFALNPQNEADSSKPTANERPVSNHQYFILEKQNSKQSSFDQSQDYSEIPNETDKTYHNYFVLEKQ
ncbi:uncharacterized protein LOC132720229 isoform X2 [Ruditapes philippinarum]|uniref:uncharacterized protein LOC132720229 isoform X2 n=1 Tax=Ruditapes philippinarum TaxID=129788 RepID=UPI00295B335D|nr:uncharacterized protein LOC132720229 isoform X2 [Ruditapes philippinarum]